MITDYNVMIKAMALLNTAFANGVNRCVMAQKQALRVNQTRTVQFLPIKFFGGELKIFYQYDPSLKGKKLRDVGGTK